MAVVRNRNPAGLAFLEWMHWYPWTYHPEDMRRFYAFAKTVARYGNKEWLRRDHFEQRIIDCHPHFDPERLGLLYQQLLDFVEFYHIPPMPTIEPNTYLPGAIYNRGVRGGKEYLEEVSDSNGSG